MNNNYKIILIGLISFLCYRYFLANYIGQSFVVFGVATIIAVLGAKFSLAEASKPFSIIFKTIITVVSVYIIIAYPTVTPNYLGALRPEDKFLLQYGGYLFGLCGVFALFRPTFGILPLTYIIWQKKISVALYGFTISATDYIILIETGIFIICCFTALKVLEHFTKQDAKEKHNNFCAYDTIFLFAIAAHFSNYFFSGMVKIMLGDSPLSWVLTNNTHYIMMAADVSGMLPLAINDTLAAFAHKIVDYTVPFINWCTLLIQVFAIVALKRIKFALIVTLCYDLMHITIFLVSGIFFWKWIIFNLAIVAALHHLKDRKIPIKLFIHLTIFTLISPLLFNIAFLGWFDSSSLNRAYFIAKTIDGKEYNVPSNYFLSGSVSVAQQKRIATPYKGHFTTGAFATVHSRGLNKIRKANNCTLPLGKESLVHENKSVPYVKRYVKEHHKFILSKADENGIFNYDLYPHHIWSNPFVFKDFYNLDKRKITSYRFVVESVCTHYDGENVGYKSMLKGGFNIEL